MKRTSRFFNTTLRVITLFSRFFLIFFLAKYLEPESLGYYGLFSATVAYSLFIVGLDFYSFSTRELIESSKEDEGRIVISSLVFSTLSTLILSIFIYTVIKHFFNWPTLLLSYFFPILLLENINQEIGRLLVAKSYQNAASIVLLFRTGIWSFLVVFLMIFHIESRDLKYLFCLWLFFDLLALIYGLIKLSSIISRSKKYIDFSWILKGIKVSLFFFVGSLFFRAIQTFDRYLVENIGSIESVAPYVLFVGIASALNAILDAGVFSYAYPSLIKLNRNKNLFIKKVNETLVLVTGCAVVFVFLCIYAIPYLLNWIGNPLYNSHVHMFPLILTSAVINGYGMVFHYAVFANRKDSMIVLSSIISFLFFFASIYILKDDSGVFAVPLGLNIAYISILLIKFYSYRKLIKVML